MSVDLPALAALRGTLSALVAAPTEPIGPEAQAEVRNRVCAAVDEMKGRAYTPEKALFAVKRTAEDAGLHPSPPRGSVDPYTSSPRTSSRERLAGDLSRWCIEHYFGVEHRG